jgi:hypothetical protein
LEEIWNFNDFSRTVATLNNQSSQRGLGEKAQNKSTPVREKNDFLKEKKRASFYHGPRVAFIFHFVFTFVITFSKI